MFIPNINPTISNTLKLSQLHQIGIVASDWKKIARSFSNNFNVSKWYKTIPNGKDDVFFRGTRIDTKFEIVLAFFGNVQVEVIQPVSGENNCYTEHLETKGGGLHHLGFCISDIDNRVKCAESKGIKVLQSGAIRSNGGAITKYAYLDSLESCGVIVELIETRLYGIPMPMSPLVMKIGCITGALERVKME
jgi:methylmalonyl-CoA/ethylmalonyl-CoA epimerase